MALENEAKWIVYHTWEEKLPTCDSNEIYIEEFWSSLNDELVQLDKHLQDEGMDGIGYRDHTEEIGCLERDYNRIWDYIVTTKRQIVDSLDHPLYIGFQNGATEWLSRIKLEKYTTENVFGIQTRSYYNPYEDGFTEHTINLEQLLGSDYNILKDTLPEEVVELTDLFSAQYESIKEQLVDSEGKLLTEGEYLSMLLGMGEFNNKMDKPLAQFGEVLLDLLIIPPLI